MQHQYGGPSDGESRSLNQFSVFVQPHQHSTAPPPPLSTSQLPPQQHQQQLNPNPMLQVDKKPARQREPEMEDELDGNESYYGGEEGRPSAKKKSKGRAVLSCQECKRRKVKCSRTIPCISCIKRGCEKQCAWEDPDANPEQQPFALATSLEAALARLDRIESFLETLPADLQRGAIRAGDTVNNGSSKPQLVERPSRTKLTNEMESVVTDLEDSTMRVNEPRLNGKMAGLDFLASAIEMVPSVHTHDSSRLPELTSASTSIVAPPLRFEGPVSSASNGYDLCFSREEMVEQRERSLDKVYSLLPSPFAAKQIVEAYFEDVAWFYNILHPAIFRAEVERFEEMLKLGRQNEVDPAWLACFFVVLALGLDGAQSIEIPPLPFATKTETSSAWYAASLRLFHLSNWPVQPQFRLVQLVALYGQYNLTTGGGTDMGGFLSYLAIGVRISQKLRLHQLGLDPKTMPPDDPALPQGVNSLKRQTAIRVFGIITFLDVVTANNRLGAYLINPSQVTTPPPDNLNFDQMSSTDWKTNPAPRHVWTDTSLELNKGGGGRYMRLVFDKLITNAKDFTYDTVLELDREMRNHVSTFPDSMTNENLEHEDQNPKLRKQRFMSMSGAYSRLVRLHRPFLVTGFTNPRYRFSTDACLQAARKVIFAHSNGREFLKNLRIVHSHTLSAVIVLYSYIFHLIDTNQPISQINGEKETVGAAYDVFLNTRVTSPMLNNVVRHATAICSLLANAVEERQAQRNYRGNVPPTESFVQVLRKIAKQLQLAQSPAADSHLSPTEPRSRQASAAGTVASSSASSISTSSFRTTPSEAPSSSMTASTSSTYRHSPVEYKSLAPPALSPMPPPTHSFAPPVPPLSSAAVPPAPSPFASGSPPDPRFAEVFLGDLGLSSTTRPGPDVYDLSWLEQDNYGMPAKVDPLAPTMSSSSYSSGMQSASPRDNTLSPFYNLANPSTASPPAHQFYQQPHRPSSNMLARSLSPHPQPRSAWFLDGSEGAGALYSQIK